MRFARPVLTYPLLWLALVTAAQYAFGWSPPPLGFLGVVFLAGYIMNTTYAMQSRGATRNNNLYHLIGAVFSNFALFLILQVLVIREFPIRIMAPYVFATVLGTLNGSQLCLGIERVFGIYADDEQMKAYAKRADPLKLWPSMTVLTVLLAGEVAYLAYHPVVAPTPKGGMLVITTPIVVLMAALSLGNGFTFTSLRTARSTDSYTFHAIVVVLNLLVDFVRLYYLVKFDMNWALFLPFATGNLIGSLLGANLAAAIVRRIGAKFDFHLLDKDGMKAREAAGTIAWPTTQVRVLLVFMTVQVVAIGFGYAALGASMLLFALALWREMSFTLKSRAGNRDNLRYLAWVSVLSNGVWYLTMQPLTMHGVTLDKALPFIVGCSVGSLMGQFVAMRIEVLLGSRVNRLSPTPVQA